MPQRLPLHNLDPSAATTGQIPAWDGAEWAPHNVPSLVPGDGIAVDNTDPYAPIVSARLKTAVFKISGVLSVGSALTRLYNDTGVTWTLKSVRASVEVAPSGGTVVVDVNKLGTTIFTNQAHRPVIADAQTTSGKGTTIDVSTVADGDFLTVDVDTATSPAAELTVIITFI